MTPFEAEKDVLPHIPSGRRKTNAYLSFNGSDALILLAIVVVFRDVTYHNSQTENNENNNYCRPNHHCIHHCNHHCHHKPPLSPLATIAKTATTIVITVT